MRKLASIQKIKTLEPIKDADAIMKATVLGWQLVVKKGEFEIGDLCVYCEIDSILPDRPEFEFLKTRNMRIRTIRLRGQVSQGICFPLSILPKDVKPVENMDVTEILKITKYEAPIPAHLEGKVKGKFPSFIPKTDETRVQVLQDLLDKYTGKIFYISEKLDGSSATFYHYNGEFGVCSRNLELLETEDNTLWKLARKLDIENKLKSLRGNFALQAEVIGESIQGNKYKLHGQDLRFFNLFDIDKYKYFDFEEFIKTLEKLHLTTVPILDTNFKMINNIEKLVELSIGKSKLHNVQREGIVLRPIHEKQDMIGRVSFKVVSPKFLLKFE